jgi:hypothetical protein
VAIAEVAVHRALVAARILAAQITTMSLARPAARLLISSSLDIAAVSLFLVGAFAVDHDLFTAGDFPNGEWGEWLGHAYRVQLVKQCGICTWDHAWTGGISPFQTYQFVPHAMTAFFSSLAGASVGRSMLVLEACLLLWVRSSGYATARLLGLPRAAALLAGVMTFGAYGYAAEVLTFSTLWGLALVPPLLIAVWRSLDAPQSYLIAALVGFSIYVHPHAALAGVIALIAVFLSGPLTKERSMRLALQGGIVMLATAFFWLPVLYSAKPPLQDSTSADPEFMRGIFEGNIDRINDLVWSIIPAVAIVTMIFWHAVRRPLFAFLVTFLGLAFFLVAVSYAGVGPENLRLMQSIRLVNLVPLGLGLMAALALDAAMSAAPSPAAGRQTMLLSTAAVMTAGLLFVPMFRFALDRGYEPARYGPDPLAAWFEGHDYGQPGRVWMEGRETSWYTFKEFARLHSARSAFTQGDWSLLARPLQEGMLVGDPGWQTTEDYLKAMAVSYLLVPDGTAADRQLRQSGSAPAYPKQLRIEGFPGETLYKAPWEPVTAFTIAAGALPALDFPRGRYRSENERTARDELTHAYVQVAYSPDATRVKVEYPSPATMRVRLTGLAPGQRLVISENWDRSWRARTSDGTGLRVHRYRPNYIEVDVSELSGDAVIELRHEMSWDWKAGIALSVLALPAAAGLAFGERRFQRARGR